MSEAAVADVRTDLKVLSLVSTGHFISHFYQFTLPALFIFLNQDLGFSYTLLGILLSARYTATGVAQIPAGFLVDRFGAKAMLIGGMLVTVTGYSLMAAVSDYWLILLMAILGGVGDSVFHPADYSILNGSVSKERIGRAYSIHTFTGQIGFAAAPAVVAYLATEYGWRTAVTVCAVIGYVIVALVVSQWSSLRDDALAPKARKREAQGGDTLKDHLKLLSSRPVMMLFLFFAMSTLAGNAVSGFSIPALNGIHGTSAVDAGLAVTAFMAAGSLSVLAGGWVADHIKRQNYFAALGYSISTLAIVLVAIFPMNYIGLVLLFGFAGFWQGIIRPARDMMVREVTPEGSTGKVFGFIFTGQNLGGAIAPLILGAMMDRLPPQWIYYAAVLFTVLCVAVVLFPTGRAKPGAAVGAP